MTDRPLLYLDTCVFIAAFEDAGEARVPPRKLLDRLVARRELAITSELTLAELLAPAFRTAMSVEERRSLYLRLFDEVGGVALKPITRSVLLETVILRERFQQRLPDAIHLATATLATCTHFISFDRDARRRPPSLIWLTPTAPDVEAFLATLDA